jgi:hypothetical protein
MLRYAKGEALHPGHGQKLEYLDRSAGRVKGRMIVQHLDLL